MNDQRDQGNNFPPEEQVAPSFDQMIQENFATFYLFCEVFSEPACRKMYPLLASYPWKPLSLRKYP